MRIPRRLTINGKRWRVVRKSLFARSMQGQCLYDRREIQIDDSLPRAEQEETFLHELMHACWGEMWGSKVEEHMIRRLSPRLLEALRDCGALR